jgi:hypothetical protein
MKLIGGINMVDLRELERLFLETFGTKADDDLGIAVYVIRGDEAFFVDDFALPTSGNKRFEKESPDSLYRGGVVGIMKYQSKFLVVPDERSQWFKPLPAGIVKFAEGADLTIAARRELMEEVFIISLGNIKDAPKKERAARYIPKGLGREAGLYNAALDLTAQKYEEIGEIVVLGYTLNKTNKAFEAVFSWIIPDELKDFTISLNEDWFAGGNSGISVFLLNQDGTLYGVFSGQQGLQAISQYGIHETLKKYM